jgi:DNA repair exonuclease SbcCD ATPase subunit
MYNTEFFRAILEKRKGQREQIQKTINECKLHIVNLKKLLTQHEKAREVIRQVGLVTQQQLQVHISDIVSLALEAVFPNPYSFQVDFIQRRNKTECDLLFDKDGEKIHPLTASGGGAVDVASFALRVASWSMAMPHSRNTLILDEPFRYLSADLLPQAGEMIKQLSEELGLQIIMVTHSEELMDCADKTFMVSQKRQVTEINTK